MKALGKLVSGIKRDPIALALLGLFFLVLSNLGDSYISNNVLFPFDPGGPIESGVAAGLFLTVGALSGMFWFVVFSFLLVKKGNNREENSYGVLHFRNRRMMLIAVISGFAGAATTSAWLYSLTQFDLSMAVPLGSFSIVYVVLIDVFIRKTINFRKVLAPSLLAFLGVLAVAVSKIVAAYLNNDLAFKLGEFMFLMVMLLVFRSGFKALSEQLDKDGGEAGGTLEYNFWRFFFLTIFAFLMVFLYLFATNSFLLYFEMFEVRLLAGLGFLVVFSIMTLPFFSNNFATAAKNSTHMTNPAQVSEVTVILSSTVVFASVIALVIDFFVPELLGKVDVGLWPLIIKVIGLVVSVYAIVRLKQLRDSR